MIDKLRLINEKLIEINQNNPEELKKQELISKLLAEKNCFMKMNIEAAYSILRDLQISEDQLKAVYMKLIDFEQENMN